MRAQHLKSRRYKFTHRNTLPFQFIFFSSFPDVFARLFLETPICLVCPVELISRMVCSNPSHQFFVSLRHFPQKVVPSRTRYLCLHHHRLDKQELAGCKSTKKKTKKNLVAVQLRTFRSTTASPDDGFAIFPFVNGRYQSSTRISSQLFKVPMKRKLSLSYLK